MDPKSPSANAAAPAASKTTAAETAAAAGAAPANTGTVAPAAESAASPTVPAASAPAPSPATIEELQAAFPNDPAFVLKAYSGKMTLGQAALEQNKALTAKLAAIEAGQAKLGNAANAGVPAIGKGPEAAPGGANVEDSPYMKAVMDLTASANIPVHQAITRINREQPKLREQYVEAQYRRGVRIPA